MCCHVSISRMLRLIVALCCFLMCSEGLVLCPSQWSAVKAQRLMCGHCSRGTSSPHHSSSTLLSGIDRVNEHDLLVRAFKGEETERTPVWLMRQAGRYMAEFRKYSEKFPFRERSETPEIAIELSLQPWRAFGTDGVIMFSDILTPLPAMGVDFTIVPGKGPKILSPVSSAADIEAIRILEDPGTQVPFLKEILGALRKETEGKTSLIGFIGAPWTLAAYSV